ncbi:D-alanyl-lipoteichoic acid biosynthesis protein DltD [Streptococcus plurextorum]|uniref:D-alanyl-lipoteichoic acid biosynthesis protein DltD n=1 Tax=Streptococcus plurextorum TaxID=456876 RepID=UPI0004260163|nr:D-alanyl-lipoteichoic acid biosynthesis protein DltD [Streptococcus plurextorum]
MLKRLWQIFGPLLCALLLVVLLFALYPSQMCHSVKAEKSDAVSLKDQVFKSKYAKMRALTDPDQNFVPFFGSSEWSRIDAFHPSVLAEAYHRKYTPFLLGQRGSASLMHYFGIQQIEPALAEKQAIYVISPQWFVKEGINKHAVQKYHSSGQTIDFLKYQTGTAYERYAACRFLEVAPDDSLKDMVAKVASGQPLSDWDRKILDLRSAIYDKEDALFSQLSTEDAYQENILPKVKELPKEYSSEALEALATKVGRQSATNNDFGIINTFYENRIAKHLKRLKGSQKKLNYLQSPEYNDLQLVLNQFAQSRVNVLFIIPPVNSKWSDFTGLDTDMYQQSVAKITYQLKSQGFTNIADFSKDGDKPYFMQDTIHMGWNGWLAMDKVVEPFLDNPQPAPTYVMNDHFLSKAWANYTGEPSDFVK